jgi:hypothetical protein
MQDSQRLDRGDVEHLTNVPLEAVKSLSAALLVGAGRAHVISGFKLEVSGLSTARVLKVVKGTAILSMRDALNQPSYGVVTAEGDAQRLLDMSGFGSGTWGVWLRFEQQDGAFANRVFWDPLAVKEFAQNVPTRKMANWGLTTVSVASSGLAPSTSPGAEWVYLGYAVISGGSLAVTPARDLFFEGTEATGTPYDQPWGTGLDRDTDRSANGLKDLSTFASAVLKKLGEIQSASARWWTAPPEPLDQKVSKHGDSVSGSYTFAGGNIYFTTTSPVYFQSAAFSTGWDLATAASPFGSAYVDTLYTKNGIQRNTTTGSATQDIGTLADSFATLYGQALDLRGTSATMVMVGHATKPLMRFFDTDVPANRANIYADTASGAPYLGLSTEGTVKRVAIMPDNNAFGGATVAFDADGGDGNPYVFPLQNASGGNGVRLGAAALRWHTVYGLNANFDFLLPKTAGTSAIGQSGSHWGDVFSDAAHIAGRVTAQQAYPDADAGAGRKLGDSSNRWASCDVMTGVFYTSLEVTGAGAGFTLGAGTMHAGANGQVNVPTIFSDANGIKVGKISGLGAGNPVNIRTNGPNFTDPIIYWDQDLYNGTIWKFRYNSGSGSPPDQHGVNPPSVDDAIILRTNGYALKCQVYNGSGYTNVWLLAYFGANLPG